MVDYSIASREYLITQLEQKLLEVAYIMKKLDRIEPNMRFTIRDKTAGRNSLVAPIVAEK